MRYVVCGAGAVGGVVGARLFQHGHDVALVARGEHYEALRRRGLRLQDPSGDQVLRIPVAENLAALRWQDGDVALLAVKSQHTAAILTELALVAPDTLPIVCLQNGVRNEEEALRRFASVYGVPVACPTAHLEPGVVRAYSAPVTGILDVGRFPAGVDDTAQAIATAFRDSSFDSHAIGDVRRWKWRKLVTNLGNAVEAVCGSSARGGPVAMAAAQEGEACLAAAGIDAASVDEDLQRRGDLLRLQPVAGAARPGGSSWQSLARRSDSIETDHLNGEIVLLGRLHGVPTPANTLLQHLANQLIAAGAEPGSVSEDDVMRRLHAT